MGTDSFTRVFTIVYMWREWTPFLLSFTNSKKWNIYIYIYWVEIARERSSVYGAGIRWSPCASEWEVRTPTFWLAIISVGLQIHWHPETSGVINQKLGSQIRVLKLYSTSKSSYITAAYIDEIIGNVYTK